ncbi:MAG: hypothetical protein DRJ42_22045 [Deltaproteobacteria bacterium]|nr:MAG: hypothetical protein DRJ42_22045 [Deltaproteobacteria bacterium]
MLLALVVLAACQGHPGRVLVVVDSDYSVPAELSEVRVLAGPVDDPESRMGQAFALTEFRPPPGGTYNLPLSLVVVPRDGNSDREVEVVVEGRLVSVGDVLVRATRVLHGFRAGDTVVLPIFLSKNCEGRVCGAGLTCIDGACESSAIDPGDLRIAEDPGEELRGLVDVGVSTDGGGDASDGAMDAGDTGDTGDAGADTGVVDDAATDSSMDSGPSDTGAPDAGLCGPPVTIPHVVLVGSDKLYPLAPAPGVWAYNAQTADNDPYVEWAHTARPGCEIWRVEPLIPSGTPEDPFADCSGMCAREPSNSALYEVYLDGRTGPTDWDELVSLSQDGVAGRVRFDLMNPSQTVSVRLSDLTSFAGAAKRQYIIIHDAVFFMRPVP